MRLALIGYGNMNRIVAQQAAAAGHEVALIVRSSAAECDADELANHLRGLDAVIDFSVAEAVERNVTSSVKAGVPIIEGTTGWSDRLENVRHIVAEANGALVFAANFSVGVNLFYRIVARAGELFSSFDPYAPFIEEAHHRRKRDAPSGTALRLQKLLMESYTAEIPTSSTRAGFIPGTHRIGFDSENDQILLTHTARTRNGFADGALLAAKWITERRGFYEFGDVLDTLISDAPHQRRKNE